MNSTAIRILAVILALSFLYAILRYHVFEGVPLDDFALYVTNKALGLAAFVGLSANFAMTPLRNLGLAVPDAWLEARKDLGIMGFMLALAHVFLSLAALGSGAYYAKFFTESGSFNAIGSWSLLLGVGAILWLWLYHTAFKNPAEGDRPMMAMMGSKSALVWAGFISAGHVTVMGYQGWMTPGHWAGGMPPITLIAFAVFSVSLVITLTGRK